MKKFLSVYAAFGFAFLHLPLLVLIVFSFNSSKFTVWEGFSLRWYQAIFHDPQMMEAARNSVVIALVSTMLSTAIGTLAAYGMWRHRDRVLQGSLYLSLVTPEIVTGISLLAFFQYIFRWLPFRLGLTTVILAHVAFSIAYVTVVITARLDAMDASLEEAAQDLGASEWFAFSRITLPLLAPGIAAAALLALTVSFDDYVITSLVAGVDSETIPMVIYSIARRGPNPTLNAVSALVVVLFGALILAAERVRETR